MSTVKSFMPLALAVVLVVGCLTVMPGQASAVTLNVFTDPHVAATSAAFGGAGTIGFAYAGDKFVGSVQKDGTNVLYSTNLTGGNVQLFAPTVNLIGSPSSEHFVTSSLGLGGFPSRDIYVAAGNTVVHINNAGTTSNTFVSGLNGSVRGILFDAIGSFGHDMLITTDSGNVYRVNSLGTTSLLASVGEDTEGLDIAPLGAGFGGHDGQLIVASEGSGRIRAITTLGIITNLTAPGSLPGAEELTFVPLNLGASGNPVEGFYGADYTPNVVKANASDFTGFLGDVVVTGEFDHQVRRVHFDGTNFVITNIGAFPNQPEDGIFVTADIVNPGCTETNTCGTVPEPSTIILLSSGLAGLVAFRHRFRNKA
jgi:hypothetical protein